MEASGSHVGNRPQEFLGVVFRHRGGLLLLLAFPVVCWALDAQAGASLAGSVLGGATLLAGVALRLGSVRRIGRGARVARAHASAGLICSGPYRWSRNPLYLAAALMLSGFGALAGGGGWAAALGPAAVAIYTPVVMEEERALDRILGEPYRRYRARVWRWIGPPGDSATSARVAWREVLRREKWLVPGSLLGALAVWGIGRHPLGWNAGLLGALWLVVALGNAVHVERKWRARQHGRTAASAGSGDPPRAWVASNTSSG